MLVLMTKRMRLNKEPPPLRKDNYERKLFFKRKKHHTLGVLNYFIGWSLQF
jgi:hypothetical protein